jgi:hypothetical protein
MKFRYTCAKYPSDKEMLSNIDVAAEKLYNKLQNLDVDSLQISEYLNVYLKSKLDNITNTLCLNCYILSWALYPRRKALDKIIFLEYGGGVGVLSLLARELGIGTVIYNDIYDMSCKDAETIANNLNLKATKYLLGDIGDVIQYFRSNSINCDSVASYDVIEHIYDLPTFFHLLPQISDNDLTVMMSSGANNANRKIRNEMMQKHINLENHDRVDVKAEKGRDCTKAYSHVRKEIIENLLHNEDKVLTDLDIDELVKRTRGMNKRDIEITLRDYLMNNNMPAMPAHPTNTCDPYTGNWGEHLFDPYANSKGLLKNEMNIRIFGGYYGPSSSVKKQMLIKSSNIMIRYTSSLGLRIAPFFSIYAWRMNTPKSTNQAPR